LAPIFGNTAPNVIRIGFFKHGPKAPPGCHIT
jgi:hypothetical protein